MSKTLGSIITDVRDKVDETTEVRWTDAEITRYINKRVAWLQSRIETFNPDYFLRVETATAAAGSNSLGIPSDILGHRLRHIQVYEGTTVALGDGSRIEPSQLSTVYAYQNLTGTPLYYTMLAGQIKFAPGLQSDSFFRFIYSVKESQLTGSNSTIGYINDEHTDVISDGAAIDCLIKTGAWDNVKGLSENLKDRLQEIANDVTPTDPVMMPQENIDWYTISD